MQPSIDLRLRAMMKALSEVVMPALDPANRMAQEQATVILGSLDLLREQIDYAHWFEVVDLRCLCDLAYALESVAGLPAIPGLKTVREHGQRLLPRSDLTLTMLREANHALREAISECVEIAGAADAEVRHVAQRLVLDHSNGQVSRDRAYVAKTKWDGYPDTLEFIDAALRKAG